MTSDDADDLLWDLSNSTSNNKTLSSAPITEGQGVSYMNYQDVNDSFQESVQEISSDEHSDEEYEYEKWCHYSGMPSPKAYEKENIKEDES